MKPNGSRYVINKIFDATLLEKKITTLAGWSFWALKIDDTAIFEVPKHRKKHPTNDDDPTGLPEIVEYINKYWHLRTYPPRRK